MSLFEVPLRFKLNVLGLELITVSEAKLNTLEVCSSDKDMASSDLSSNAAGHRDHVQDLN